MQEFNLLRNGLSMQKIFFTMAILALSLFGCAQENKKPKTASPNKTAPVPNKNGSKNDQKAAAPKNGDKAPSFKEEDEEENEDGTDSGTGVVVPKAEESFAGTSVPLEKYWRFHKWGAIGYRYDRQKFDAFHYAAPNHLDSEIEIHGRNTVMLNVGSHLEVHSLVLDVRGSYGWLIDGSLDYNAQGGGIDEPLSFHGFSLGAGYSADARAVVGWNCKLVKKDNFMFALIPGVGYRYSHLMNYPQGVKQFSIPSPPVLLDSSESGYARAQFSAPNQQDWFGPLVEAKTAFRLWDRCEIDFFYQFHWLSLRSRTKWEEDVYLFNPPSTLSEVQLNTYRTVLKSGKVYASLGGMDLMIHYPSGWSMGVYFEGSRTTGAHAAVSTKRARSQYLAAPVGETQSRYMEEARVLWVNYAASTFVGYKF